MPEPEAAVAIVNAGGPTGSVLLIRRAERQEDPWSGHWSFPGGRRDERDRDPLETALRELEEECGIRLGRDQSAGALPVGVARRRVGPFLRVAPFVFHVESEQAATVDRKEAVEAVWVPLAVLRDPARHALRIVPGVPPERRFPAVDLNGLPLWGFTYRLITEWLELNPPQAARRQAAFEAAAALLDFLLAQGCKLDHEWIDRGGTQVASVKGAIPVEAVWAETSRVRTHIPRINTLEVHADRIRIAGLAFEEYLINVIGPDAAPAR